MNTLLFQSKRFEDKYSVSQKRQSGILAFLKRYGRVDPHAGVDGSYEVLSLYFDTLDLKCYHDYQNGIENRFKLRLRSYGDSSEKKLELKLKENRITYKVSCSWNGSIPHDRLLLPQFETLRPDIYNNLKKFQFRPTVFTRYERFAFQVEQFRVTLDKRISFAKFTPGDSPMFRSINDSVLEVKGMGNYPEVIRELLNTYQLQRESFSKYARAIRELNLD